MGWQKSDGYVLWPLLACWRASSGVIINIVSSVHHYIKIHVNNVDENGHKKQVAVVKGFTAHPGNIN